MIGAGRHEHNGERTTWRNEHQERALDARLSTLNLRVPKLRQVSCFPGFPEPRKTSGKALMAVIQKAIRAQKEDTASAHRVRGGLTTRIVALVDGSAISSASCC